MAVLRSSTALAALVLLVAGLVVASIALASAGGPAEPAARAGTTGATSTTADALPTPDAALPTTGGGLAASLTSDVRGLRARIPAWQRTGGDPPEPVTLLALHAQRTYRELSGMSDARADRIVAATPADVRGEVRDTVLARRALAEIPRSPGKVPPVKTARAEPPEVLKTAYLRAQQRFGVSWTVLAAVNFVESAFGRVRSASEAGARGPMQFLPATWRAYGLGGDIDLASDAILGAANYLHQSGAPRSTRAALFAYNRSTSYGSAILRFAARMHQDPRAFWSYYAWQVYVRRSDGSSQRLTGPGL